MNQQIIAPKEPIKKLCISSNDRINKNDDSSSFSCNFQEIGQISKMIVRKAYLPLSSFTFSSETDPDLTFEYGRAPAANGPTIKNILGQERFFNFRNTIKKPAGIPYGAFNPGEAIVVRKDSLFMSKFTPQTNNSVMLRIWNAWSEANNQSYQSFWPLGVSRYYSEICDDIRAFTNTNVWSDFYMKDLRCKSNWKDPYKSNAEAQNSAGGSTTFITTETDLDRDFIYFYQTGVNVQTGTVFNIGWYEWNSATSKYDLPIPNCTVSNVNYSELNTKSPSGSKIFTMRPPNSNSNYAREIIAFSTNTPYTEDSLVTYLNSVIEYNKFGILFTKTPIATGAPQYGNTIAIQTPPQTGYRRIAPYIPDDPRGIAMRRLGFQYTMGENKYWDDVEPAAVAPIDIYLEEVCFSVSITSGTTTWAQFLTRFHEAQADKAIKINTPLQMELEYIAPKTLSTFVPDLNYYAINMESGADNILSLAVEVMAPVARDVYFPANNGLYNIGQSINGGLIPAIGFPFYPYRVDFTILENQTMWAVRAPTYNILQFDTGVLYTEASMLAQIQTITTTTPDLVFSLVNRRLKIQNISESIGYAIYNNTRLGLYSESGYFVLPPQSYFTTPHIIDVSSNNDVIYLSLSCYNAGSNSINPDGTSRQLRNIVCSIYNSRDYNYGSYIEYTDDSSNWLETNATNLSSIKVDIYDIYWQPLILNGISTHFEIDFK